MPMHARHRLLPLAVLAALAALVVAALAAAGIAGAFARTSAGGSASAAGTLASAPDGATLRVPAGLHVEKSTNGPGLVTFAELTVANFAQVTAVHSGSYPGGGYVRDDPPLNPRGRFPATGVAFRLEAVDGGPPYIGDEPDSRFPLAIGTFARDGFRQDARKGVPRSWSRPVVADGQRLTATIWIGPRASASAHKLLAEVVSSVRFPRLHPGQQAGDFQILNLASAYRVGSFTLVHEPGQICGSGIDSCHPGSQPFFLVRAPGTLPHSMLQPCPVPHGCSPAGGFYVLSWTAIDVGGGYISSCDIRLDPVLDDFFCTNMAARWDRFGRMIARPPDTPFAENLQVAFAKVGWDGHVMFEPGLYGNPPLPRELSTLWPGWNRAADRRAADRPAGTPARVYRDPAGWSLKVPAGLSLEHDGSGVRTIFVETTAANFRQVHAIRSGPLPGGGGYIRTDPPLDPHGRFPADGVAFRMLRVDGGPGPVDDVPDSRFPLTLASFAPDGDHTGADRGVPVALSRSIVADGEHFTATIWVGPRASRRARSLLAAVTASLAFPRLHPGEQAGDFVVLGRSAAYAIGSITRIAVPTNNCPTAGACRPGRAPYYLVHAPGRLPASMILPCGGRGGCTPPGAFYALGWSSEFILGGYISRCDLRLDPARKDFYCTNMRARWDRFGRVLQRPAGTALSEPLNVTFVKVGWDGHLMLLAGTEGSPPRGGQLQTLWPGWNR